MRDGELPLVVIGQGDYRIEIHGELDELRVGRPADTELPSLIEIHAGERGARPSGQADAHAGTGCPAPRPPKTPAGGCQPQPEGEETIPGGPWLGPDLRQRRSQHISWLQCARSDLLCRNGVVSGLVCGNHAVGVTIPDCIPVCPLHAVLYYERCDVPSPQEQTATPGGCRPPGSEGQATTPAGGSPRIETVECKPDRKVRCSELLVNGTRCNQPAYGVVLNRFAVCHDHAHAEIDGLVAPYRHFTSCELETYL